MGYHPNHYIFAENNNNTNKMEVEKSKTVKISNLPFYDKMEHKVKRYFLKKVINNRKWFNKDMYIHRTPNEKKVIAICHQLILSEGAKLSYKPDGLSLGKRYIENDKVEKYIIIDDTLIKIVNGVCSYDIPVSIKTAKSISIIFDSKVNGLRNVLEEKINSKVKHSLDTIYVNLVSDNNKKQK